MTTPRITYLASQKLHLLEGGKPTEIRSAFGQEVIERALRTQERHAWKNRDGGADPFSGRMLWGSPQAPGSKLPVHITAVCRGEQAGQILYLLETDAIGGLFSYDLGEKEELRIFHREQFRARDLAMHPSGQRLAASIPGAAGANIAVGCGDGRRLEEVTEGDSFDGGPSWAPDSETVLLFHSAGVIRNGQGHAIGRGPCSIEQLDLETGDLKTLLENSGHDLLEPKRDAQGNLWYIRRPYEAMGKRISPWAVVKDIVLFPYRLLRAIVHFTNAFSMFFSKKPLLTATEGPRTKEEERPQMWLWGKMLDAQHPPQSAGAEALVPRDWELVKRSAGGSETVVAHHVGSYDLDSDGEPVFSTGLGIYALKAGKKTKLADGFLIETVRVVG